MPNNSNKIATRIPMPSAISSFIFSEFYDFLNKRTNFKIWIILSHAKAVVKIVQLIFSNDCGRLCPSKFEF